MKDVKTTSSAIATALLSVLAHYNIVIPEGATIWILAIGFAITGYFAADSKTSN